MTDTPQTPTAVDTALVAQQIEVFNTLLKDANPDLRQDILQRAENSLGTAYAAAEQRGDKNTMDSILAAWDNMNALAAAADTAFAAADGATAMAGSLAADNARLLTEHETLLKAIDEMDWDHPAVANLIETVEEGVAENIYTGWYDSDAEGFYEDVHANVTSAMGMTDDEASTFINAIKDGQWGVTVDDCNMMVAYFLRLKVQLEAQANQSPATSFEEMAARRDGDM